MDDDFDRADSDGAADLILEVWQRRKWLAVTAFALVLAGALSVAAWLPSLYRATSKVIVDHQEVSEAFVQPAVTAELETRIQTIDQRVRSRENLGAVIERMDLYKELRPTVPLEWLVDRMRKDTVLRLEGVPQADGRNATIAFTLTYRGRDPVTVAKVANTMAELYVEENTRMRRRQADQTTSFLAQEVADVQRALEDQERRAGEYAQSFADELPAQREVNMAAIDRFSDQIRQNGETRLRILERRERLENELAAAAAKQELDAAPTEETPSARLNRLRRERAEMRQQFSDQYPDVIRLSAEIAALEAQAAGVQKRDEAPKPRPRLTSPAIAQVDEQLAALTQEDERLMRAIASYESRVEVTPRRQNEMERLSRGNAGKRERYETLLQRYEAARLAANVELAKDLEQFRVLDPAVPPSKPFLPNRLMLVGMGLAAALGFAVAVVIAAEKLDATFHTADAVRAFTSIPVLATIRQARTAAVVRRRRHRMALGTCAAVLAIGLIVAGSYYVATNNEEMVRMIARGDA
jgi:polysaccharide chain length determinant protein (PEP-CTERM system associated)